MQQGINTIPTRHISISILVGISIVIAYAMITSTKINSSVKVIFGYFGVIIFVPLIHYYLYFGRLFIDSMLEPYRAHAIIPFYIVFTSIFLVIYFINYRVGVKMTKKLNANITKK